MSAIVKWWRIAQITKQASEVDMIVEVEKVSGEIIEIQDLWDKFDDIEAHREFWEETLTDMREIRFLERDWFYREIDGLAAP